MESRAFLYSPRQTAWIALPNCLLSVFLKKFLEAGKKQPCSSQWMMAGYSMKEWRYALPEKQSCEYAGFYAGKILFSAWKQFRKTPWISPIFEKGSDCHVFSFGLVGHFACFLGKSIIIMVEGQMVFRGTRSVTEMWRFLYVIFQQSVQRASVQKAGAFCIACWGQ